MIDLNHKLLKIGRVTPYDFVPLDEAQYEWANFRSACGLSDNAVPLFTDSMGNFKLATTMRLTGVHIVGLALAAHAGSGFNVCRYSTPACRAGCLQYAGRNQGSNAQMAQKVRTEFLYTFPEAFQTLVAHELRRFESKHTSSLRVRLNVLSDVTWEDVFPALFETFSAVKFYDYTKWPVGKRSLPANYHLTYSASERTHEAEINAMVNAGYNVAVVFNTHKKADLPSTYRGLPVIDADKNDDRTSDPRGVIVGLRAKGRMRQGSPMVRKVA